MVSGLHSVHSTVRSRYRCKAYQYSTSFIENLQKRAPHPSPGRLPQRVETDRVIHRRNERARALQIAPLSPVVLGLVDSAPKVDEPEARGRAVALGRRGADGTRLHEDVAGELRVLHEAGFVHAEEEARGGLPDFESVSARYTKRSRRQATHLSSLSKHLPSIGVPHDSTSMMGLKYLPSVVFSTGT